MVCEVSTTGIAGALLGLLWLLGWIQWGGILSARQVSQLPCGYNVNWRHLIVGM